MIPVSRRDFMKYSVGAAAVFGAAACGTSSTPAPSASAGGSKYPGLTQFTMADWGGSTDQAFLSAYGKPFTKATGVPMVSVALDYGKLQAQVQNNQVTWGDTDSEGWFVHAKSDLLEPLDYAAIGVTKEDMVNPEFMQPNGVANYVYGWVQAYRTDSKKKHPTNWVEFFDTKNFPGTRSLYNYCYGSLELALLGDGVPYDQLYPLDVERAFRKIASIKKDLVYWNTGAQSQQFLVSGTADFVAGWNPRFGYLALTGLPVAIEWNQQMLAADYHAVPKGGKYAAASMEFIKTAMQPENQANFAELSGGLAGSVTKANDTVPDRLKPWLPTTPENLAKSVGAQNDTWWGTNFDAVNAQWTKFTAG